MHEISQLPNGLRIVTRTMTETESVTVNFFVGAGGRYEDLKTEYGVSHFLEHLLFKGTHKRPTAKQISEEIDSVGGYINAYTTEDHTSYYIKLPKNYFGLAFNVMADIMTDPLFEQSQIDLERNVILEEMKVFKDDPSRYVFDFVGDLLWPQDTLRTNVIGNEQIINTMSRDTIVDYFKQLYTMNNMVISVAGNITHKQVIDIAMELLSINNSKVSRTWQPVRGRISKDKVYLKTEDTNQAHIVLAGRAPNIDAKDEAAMKLLCTILGSGSSSRLFMNVRELKALAYTVHMGYYNFIDSGKFEIYAGVNHDKVPEALDAINEELHKIQQNIVDPKELNKAKEQVRGHYIMGLEGNAAVADMMGLQMILTGRVRTLQESLQKIDEVSVQDVLEVAQSYLHKDSVKLAMIGPFEQEKKQEFEKLMEK